ncbi:radical SAM protein [Cytobacillus pseudoceanisediminis]|uniref:radical SAM protein n=1 Tax=Cytobacillus pseudoceanisediminis TaxID=3051614 RepID=UPI003664BCA5
MKTISRRIQLSGGNKCFVRCPGCYNFFSNKDYVTEDLLDFLTQLKDKVLVPKVTMSGGEPLAREDMPYILSALKELGYRINLDTVGLSLIRDVIVGQNTLVKKISSEDIISSIDVIGIPFDGSSDDLMNMFRRGLKVDEILGILDDLSSKGANICINTVVHKNNYDDIQNIYELIKPYQSITKWQLFQFMPIGPGGYKNRLKYELSDQQFENLREALDFDTVIDIQLKSRLNRKNKYLLIDGEGVVWIPRQNEHDHWLTEDENNERILIGNISDENAVDKVLDQLEKYDKVLAVN